MTGPIVLIVDDDADVRLYAGEVLEEAGYRVAFAGNGTDALGMIGEGAAVDLLVTDIVMPGGLSGLDLGRQARSLRPGLKVLYASGYWSHIITDLDPQSIVRKPYRPKDLTGSVGRALSVEGCEAD